MFIFIYSSKESQKFIGCSIERCHAKHSLCWWSHTPCHSLRQRDFLRHTIKTRGEPNIWQNYVSVKTWRNLISDKAITNSLKW